MLMRSLSKASEGSEAELLRCPLGGGMRMNSGAIAENREVIRGDETTLE